MSQHVRQTALIQFSKMRGCVRQGVSLAYQDPPRTSLVGWALGLLKVPSEPPFLSASVNSDASSTVSNLRYLLIQLSV